MSADNWAICPQCVRNQQRLADAADQKAAKAYGAVTVDVFEEMRDKARRLRTPPLEATFREDYEFYGAEDGILSIRYGGSCSVCKLSHQFKDDQTIVLEADA